MPLTTQFAPLSTVLSVVVPSIIATSAIYEYFRVTHPPAVSFTTAWMNSTHDATEHKSREASTEAVIMDPFRRAREHGH